MRILEIEPFLSDVQDNSDTKLNTNLGYDAAVSENFLGIKIHRMKIKCYLLPLSYCFHRDVRNFTVIFSLVKEICLDVNKNISFNS